ncbi:hypothetical protein DF196_02765 [Bifidobacterium callitrichidarum]|uniref:Uncharacterized protein n=1 Tax=Bifidobacterium callitrichidarum TaxID=2052941 RepID=A0A2U2NBQ1_9BIFI|nr:hypothetical protein DF196_02765 [Bifidobacterium callitrichidarum]
MHAVELLKQPVKDNARGGGMGVCEVFVVYAMGSRRLLVLIKPEIRDKPLILQKLGACMFPERQGHLAGEGFGDDIHVRLRNKYAGERH